MKSKNTKQVEKMWTAQDEEMLSYCSDYLDEKQIEWLESIKQRLSAQTNLLMDYEKVLGEHKFPTYEELKTGLIRLIDEGKISREDASRLLPELRESEDERIRKWLVDYFSSIKDTVWIHRDDISCEQILAYLEKQKDQKPNYCHHEVDETGWTEEYRKAYYDGWNNCNMQHEQLKADQKNTEWSEEDEAMLDSVIRIITRFDDLAHEPTFAGPKWTHPYTKEIAWLKSLRLGGCYSSYDMAKAFVEGQNNILENLDKYRPSFKPSEELLEALHTAAYIPEMEFYGGLKDKLRELYKHLINE